MADDRLLTTDPTMIARQGMGQAMHAGMRNEVNNQMTQSGLNTMLSSEELRAATTTAVTENEQLRAQLTACVTSMRQKMQDVEKMKHLNMQLTQQLIKLHDMSRVKVRGQQEKITALQDQNQQLTSRITELSKQSSSGVSVEAHQSQRGPILVALKGHMQAVEEILKQELSSLKDEDRENAILEKLMGHIKKAEEILSIPDVQMNEGALKVSTHPVRGESSEGGSPRSPAIVTTPVSPTGQQAYNQSMQNVLAQLHALRKQVDDKSSTLNKERERNEDLEARLGKTQSELDALQGSQESHVAEAIERQRAADDMQHQHEMGEMMAKLDELTLLAADKHERHAFDEEPRYHSASNELKQQVTSLVAELEHKERCLEEEKTHQQQQRQMNEALQMKVMTYNEELKKARREAESYIDTVHGELKRKETMYQTERQKAMHEKLQHDKCKDELGTLQGRFNMLQKEKNRLSADIHSFQMKTDRHYAEILSAEEAIEAKELEKKQSVKQVAKLKSDIDIWKTQTEVCQRDFREERRAREQMHQEKLILQAKIEDLMREKHNLEEELQYFHRQQLQQVRYRPHERTGGADMYGARRQVYDVPGDDEAGLADQMNPYQREQPYRTQALRPPQQATTENWCPKCEQTFPDFDTLNIHIADCID